MADKEPQIMLGNSDNTASESVSENIGITTDADAGADAAPASEGNANHGFADNFSNALRETYAAMNAFISYGVSLCSAPVSVVQQQSHVVYFDLNVQSKSPYSL